MINYFNWLKANYADLTDSFDLVLYLKKNALISYSNKSEFFLRSQFQPTLYAGIQLRSTLLQSEVESI